MKNKLRSLRQMIAVGFKKNAAKSPEKHSCCQCLEDLQQPLVAGTRVLRPGATGKGGEGAPSCDLCVRLLKRFSTPGRVQHVSVRKPVSRVRGTTRTHWRGARQRSPTCCLSSAVQRYYTCRRSRLCKSLPPPPSLLSPPRAPPGAKRSTDQHLTTRAAGHQPRLEGTGHGVGVSVSGLRAGRRAHVERGQQRRAAWLLSQDSPIRRAGRPEGHRHIHVAERC